MVMPPFIRSDQNHHARHSERRKKTRQTEEEMRRQHQGMDRPGVRQVPEGGGEQGKMEKTGCRIICGAPATLAAEFQRRKQAIEMRCYRKILHSSYKDHVTNEEVRAKIQQEFGPHEDLLTIVKRR